MNTRLPAALVALAALGTGCHHHVNVGYLQAADVTIDPEIQTVLVIDRSRPGNVGEHMLNGMEGALTGERYRLDAESAAFAIQSLEGVIGDAPRFEVVTFQVNGRDVDTTHWDRQMMARQVRQLCAEARCDAVIALETFDSDQATVVTTDVDRLTEAEQAVAKANGDCESRRCDADYTYTADQYTDVTATFRMYDGRTGHVIDELRTGVSQTATHTDTEHVSGATMDLPFEASVFDGAGMLGVEYAARVSPHQVVAARDIYGTGSKAMRQARRAAKNGDLQTARALWRDEANTADAKTQARALHNLAVAAEAMGDVDGALRLARKASRMGGKNRTVRYVAQLQDRQANDALVDHQLAPPARTEQVSRHRR
jgi:hypothetical protein